MIPITLDQVSHAIGAVVEPADRNLVVSRVTTDTRELRSGDLFFAIVGPRFDGHDFVDEAISRGAVACICSRDVLRAATAKPRTPCLQVADTAAALGRLAAYYRQHVISPQTVIVAVTGTNGKTTTKFMLDQILGAELPGRASPKSFNNHIGVPLTLLSADREDRYVIVEIGTNAPGEIAHLAAMAAPEVAVITSIGEAHLQGLGSIAAIAAEKASLLDCVRAGGLAVVNSDRAEIRPHLEPIPVESGGMAKRSAAMPYWDGILTRNRRIRVITIGLQRTARVRVTEVSGTIRKTHCKLDGRFEIELPIPGSHHATNAAAAFAVARWFGLDPRDIIARLATFQPPEGRTCVREVHGVTIVDDTYNANPASVSAAIEALGAETGRRRVFVLGDMLELGATAGFHHRRAVQAICDAGIEVLVAVGPNAMLAADSCREVRSALEIMTFVNVESATIALREFLCPGDVVWIKGSRGMKLDRLVESLNSHSSREVAVA